MSGFAVVLIGFLVVSLLWGAVQFTLERRRAKRDLYEELRNVPIDEPLNGKMSLELSVAWLHANGLDLSKRRHRRKGDKAR